MPNIEYNDTLKERLTDEVILGKRRQNEVLKELCEINNPEGYEAARQRIGMALDAEPPSAQSLSRWVRERKHTPSSLNHSTQMDEPVELARITFGAVLIELRKRHAHHSVVSRDDFAAHIRISSSALRMIESGQNLPPTSLAHSLAKQCHLSLFSVLLVIAFSRAVDEAHCKEEAKDIINQFVNSDIRFAPWGDAIRSAILIPYGKRKPYLTTPDLVDKVIAIMKTQTSRPESVGNPVVDAMLGQVSPLLMGSISQVIYTMGMYQPVLDPLSLAQWEQQNKNNIRCLYSYHDDIDNLYKTVDAFHCEFAVNSTERFRYFIILGNNPSPSAIKKLKQKIVSKDQRIPEDSIVILHDPHFLNLNSVTEKGLYFDIDSSRLVVKHKSLNTIPMKNINLYKMSLSLPSGGTTDWHCGIVDNACSTQNIKRPFLARALSMDDTLLLKEFFETRLREYLIHHA